jgi:hypothetical protein
VADGRVHIGSTDRTVYALDTADGWTVTHDSLVFETVLGPDEERRTIVGRLDCPVDRLDDLLDRPDIDTETTRPTGPISIPRRPDPPTPPADCRLRLAPGNSRYHTGKTRPAPDPRTPGLLVRVKHLSR